MSTFIVTIHFFNRISFYTCPYLARHDVPTEYWLGHNRKKIFQNGKFTVWVRE